MLWSMGSVAGDTACYVWLHGGRLLECLVISYCTANKWLSSNIVDVLVVYSMLLTVLYRAFTSATDCHVTELCAALLWHPRGDVLYHAAVLALCMCLC